jgi:hypothetical protein
MFVGIVAVGILGLITSVLMQKIERMAIPGRQMCENLPHFSRGENSYSKSSVTTR